MARIAFLIIPVVFVAGAAPRPLFQKDTERPLRYRPEGKDFVIVNGSEFFNRPLYGSNTPFRVDAGDRPEFTLYLPGRGGNLRLGIKSGSSAKWLKDADHIVARYRAAEMVYEFKDPLLGAGALQLTVLSFSETEGLVAKVVLSRTKEPVDLLWAYGGASGERGGRDGDIGTEREPVTRFFQLKPEYCRGNRFEIAGNRLVLHSKPGDIAGVFPEGSKLSVSDANRWQSWRDLASGTASAPELPVVIGQVQLQTDKPEYLALQRVEAGHNSVALSLEAYPVRPDVRGRAGHDSQPLLPPYSVAELPNAFDKSEVHFRQLADSIKVDTPDPFINAAAGAIGIAEDGVWDEPQGVVMHGAVAWRARLLGWRGAYALDALGWHDRMRRHLSYWIAQQNTSPVVSGSLFKPDTNSNLSRSENAIHSNGDMSKNHYDMNLVFVDGLLRNLLWTGDMEFAKQVWPVIERHLAWERRLFRRPFGPDRLPLYEAYNAIWASDNLQYDGAGVTHSSAYNYYQNKMGARIAKWIGLDPSTYETEGAAIQKAMRRELWLPQQGWYAESRDILGLRLAHPAAAAWTFFHTTDSEAATPMEAYQMSREVDTQLGHIPIHGPGVPPGDYNVLAYTNWMPYIWSINNVVMGDNMHTALGYWQSGLDKKAFDVYKGNLLDSMYMGLCPGDIHMSSQFDDYRQESQRDFADPIAMTSRATVEGLFGIVPDMLAGELRIQPGFPRDWDHASIEHRDLAYSWRLDAAVESYSITPKFPKPTALRLISAARSAEIASVSVNGHAVAWHVVESAVGTPRIEILAPAAPQFDVKIQWKGEPPAAIHAEKVAAIGHRFNASVAPARLEELADPQQALTAIRKGESSFEATVTAASGHHTVFAEVRQGQLTWWIPIDFESRPPLEILASAEQKPGSLTFRLRDNTNQSPTETAVNFLPADGLPGTMKVRSGGAEGLVTNWNIRARAAKWDAINLTAAFNDQVTRIFRNEYLSPRSPYASLSIPKQGIGGWSAKDATAEIDDSGLRAAARAHQGIFETFQGIPFRTSGDPNTSNIVFTSQWDNYPREKSVPLSGKAVHVYLLMAGSTNSMQSRMDNGEIVVAYADGTSERLALYNPTTWWPIDQDYLIDDYQFPLQGALPPRVDLKTGQDRIPVRGRGEQVRGGAATVLDMPLDPGKELKSLTVRTIANEVVIGLMSVTLAR